MPFLRSILNTPKASDLSYYLKQVILSYLINEVIMKNHHAYVHYLLNLISPIRFSPWDQKEHNMFL